MNYPRKNSIRFFALSLARNFSDTHVCNNKNADFDFFNYIHFVVQRGLLKVHYVIEEAKKWRET